MATIKILSGLICFAFISSNGFTNGNMLAHRDVVTIARAEVGVRERSGKNDGPRVKEYLAAVGLKEGNPYCAAWISWVFLQSGYPAPRTGWSPDLFPAKRLTKEIMPGVVFGVYFPALGRIAHCGMVEKTQHDWVHVLEANTNASGGREGEGVYARMRHRRTIRCYAEWR